MFYLDDHNPKSTQIESEHERQQRRVSAAELKSFVVDNRPPMSFTGLTTYQSGWLIKGFARAGIDVDERKKEMAARMLNLFGEVSNAILPRIVASVTVHSCSGVWSGIDHGCVCMRVQKEPPETERNEREIIARVLRKNTAVNPQLSDCAIVEQISNLADHGMAG